MSNAKSTVLNLFVEKIFKHRHFHMYIRLFFFWKNIQDTINKVYLWKEDYFYNQKMKCWLPLANGKKLISGKIVFKYMLSKGI